MTSTPEPSVPLLPSAPSPLTPPAERIPEFDPPDTKVRTDSLKERCDDAWKLTGRVMGDAGTGRAAITRSAKEFSDLIDGDISSAGAFNEKEWRKACLALTYAASIADRWREDVEEFRRERKKLIDRYSTAIVMAGLANEGNPMYRGTGPLQSPPTYGPHVPSPRQLAYYEVHREYMAKGRKLKDGLEETAAERATLLKEGPEPSNLKVLVEAGVLGWGAYNILGAERDVPLPVSSKEAKEMAREMKSYLDGDKEPDARFHEIIAALGAVSAKAKKLQEAGRSTLGQPYQATMHRPTLGEEELDFLETFYEELDEMSPTGIVHMMPWLEGSSGPGWSSSERDAFATGVANGLLILSDEKVGGGQYRLPDGVQDFAHGLPFNDWRANGMSEGRAEGVRSHNWLADAEDFSLLLKNADSGLRGGLEFSTNVTLSLGHHLDNTDLAITRERNEALSSLLDVSTRNVEANHSILTGNAEHPAGHVEDARYSSEYMPDFKNTTDALVGLYAFDWADDGEAAAGLTDWIPRASESESGSQRRMAREAAEGLIRTTVSDKDVFDSLTNTGITVKETVEVDGKKVDVEYPDAVFSRVNPKLSNTFADIALAYLEDFSIPGNKNEPEGGDKMKLGYEERQRFLQFAAADDATVRKLYQTAELLDLNSTNQLLGEDEQKDIAYRNSTFRALLDAAVRGDTLDRSIDMDNAEAQAAVDKKRKIAMVSGLAFGGANLLSPAGGGAAISGITTSVFELNDRVDQSVKSDNYLTAVDAGIGDDSTHAFGANDYGRTYSQMNHDYKTKLDLLDAMVRDGRIDTRQVEAVSPQLLTDDGKVVDYYEFSTDDRTGARDDKTKISPDTALDRLLKSEEATITYPDKTSREAHEVAAQYSQAYHTGYYEVIEKLSADIDKEDYKENTSR
ncbi:hypothetical protein [Nocardiopsis sp. NPDC006832]|uniref:TPR repeat region-containing protein n=1 Tax=Nocardiopsis sp. NPDC006832 TaxID=3157188 RepID=UPI0033F8169B